MSGQAEITLSAGPEVSIGTLPSLCESVNQYLLTGGLPTGGTFSGAGVTDNVFYPANVGQGAYSITYSYTDLDGCTGSASAIIDVLALPTVSLSASTPVCVDSDPITLYGYPEGGLYEGLGVTDNLFNPSLGLIGLNPVSYSYTDANGCSNYTSFSIEVLPLPVVSFEAVAPMCINSNPVQLNVSPAGGWIDGAGAYEMDGSFYFNPVMAGTFTVTYYYASVEGCQASATQEIVVNDLPVVSFEPIPNQCLDASNYVLMALPAGGTFAGPGVVDGMFHANLVDPGFYYDLTYTYVDANGCSNGATQFVYVLPPNLLEMYYTDVVCADEDSVTLIGYPAGGTFSGLGVSDGFFLPNTVGAGTYSILYSYTDENGCTSTLSGTLTVNPVPEIIFNALDAVCVGTEYVALQASPAGGYFDGYNVYQDIDNNWYFYANSIEPGDYTITYYFSNGFNCLSSVSQILTVNPLPEVSIDPVADLCFGSNPVVLHGTPEGGVFSGIGVDGNHFNLAGLNPDYYTVTYTVTLDNGCSNSASTSFYLNALPELYFTAPAAMCIDAEPVELYAYPAGGTFSGAGITGNLFDAASAGAGTHFITYSYTDLLGCSNSIMDTIIVNSLPEVSIVDLPSHVCFNASPVLLSGVPAGGTFTGPGVYYNGIDYEFWPDYAFLGENIIDYQVTNEFGCTNSTSIGIFVNPVPVVSIEPVSDICATQAPVALIASPEGGVFSGTGVVGNTFNPALASTTEYNIVTYTFTDESGCSASAMISIWVNPAPVIEMIAVSDLCLGSAPVQLYAYPTGGFFSGAGVLSNMFDPALAGIGSHTIVYTYTDGFGCTGSAEQTIEVYAAPVVTFEPLNDVCSSVVAVELFASPLGGYFDGPGVAGNFFYPETVGAGTYSITYFYNAGNDCAGSASQSITVNAAPLVTLDPVASLCIDNNAVVLNGLPEGGVYSGTGVTGNEFTPSIAGPGTFTLTYVYVDPTTSCTGSATREVTVNNNPGFFSGPSNASIFAGENTFFQAIGIYANTFQWQVSSDNGLTWSDLTDNGIYSGVTTEMLTITGATLAMNGNMYQCLAFSDCPTFAFSPSALLTVESNAIDVTAGTVQNCANEVTIPVTVANLYNVASMSLTLTFDDNTLTYSGYSDLNPALTDGIYSINAIGNQVKLGYFSITPVNFGSGLLVNYHFTSTGGYSDLTWDILVPGNCEFNTLDETIIPSNYFNGSATVNPLPIAYDVMGGGVYCAGSDGKEVYLSNSEAGVMYVLYFNGVATENQLPGTGGMLSFGMFTTPGSYSVFAMNTLTGCTNSMIGAVTVDVNIALFANAGDDVSIFEGSTAALGVIVDGGTAPYTYSWTPAESLSDASIANPVASPVTTTLYSVMVTDFYGCTATDDVLVTVLVPADQFGGFITYDNNLSSPMANTQVDLYQAGVLIASTTTGANGEYEFTDLANGSYSVIASTTKAWGGGNAADGLLMLRHFVGNPLLTGLRLQAGDVSGNGVINGLDAFLTVKRFAQFSSSFAPVGDWFFEQPTVTIDGFTTPVVNIKAICTGDVNGDYLPPYLKPEPTINVNREGYVNVVNGHAILPVISNQDLTIGALSLVIQVPSTITINNVTLANSDENLVFNRINNELRIGWFNLNPLQIQAGQAIVNLDVNVSGSNDAEFVIDGYSTISDQQAVTFKNVDLNIPKLSQTNLTNSLNSYPNPFTSNSTVSYSIGEAGQVNIRLFNMIGEQVITLVNKHQDSGSYQINLDVNDLPQGVYLLKMETNGVVLTQMVNRIK